MTLYRNKYRVESTRLPNYDYSADGCYFITICTKNRKPVFGKIVQGEPVLSEIGVIADRCWCEIPDHFPFVRLFEYVIKPDHVHGIIVIDKSPSVNRTGNPDGDGAIARTTMDAPIPSHNCNGNTNDDGAIAGPTVGTPVSSRNRNGNPDGDGAIAGPTVDAPIPSRNRNVNPNDDVNAHNDCGRDKALPCLYPSGYGNGDCINGTNGGSVNGSGGGMGNARGIARANGIDEKKPILDKAFAGELP